MKTHQETAGLPPEDQRKATELRSSIEGTRAELGLSVPLPFNPAIEVCLQAVESGDRLRSFIAVIPGKRRVERDKRFEKRVLLGLRLRLRGPRHQQER